MDSSIDDKPACQQSGASLSCLLFDSVGSHLYTAEHLLTLLEVEMRLLMVIMCLVAGVAMAQQEHSGEAGWIDLDYGSSGMLRYYYADGGWSNTWGAVWNNKDGKFTLTLKPSHGDLFKSLPAEGLTISGMVKKQYTEAASGIYFDSAGIFDVRGKTVIGWVICQSFRGYYGGDDRRSSCTLEFSGGTGQDGVSTPWYTINKNFGKTGKLCSLSGTVGHCYGCEEGFGFHWHSRRFCD